MLIHSPSNQRITEFVLSLSEDELDDLDAELENIRMATTTRQQPKSGAPRPGAKAPTAPAAARAAPTVRSIIPSPQKGLAHNPFVSPFTIFMYGISGVGKSSMWAYLPDVVYVHDPQEEGIVELVKFGQVPEPNHIECCFDYPSTLTFLDRLANKKIGKKCQHVVVESATGFERLIFQDHCEKEFDGDWSKDGFMAYGFGPKNAAKTIVPEFLEALDNCKRAGIGVVFTGHAQVKPFKNPNGNDYDQYKPYLDNDTWQQIHRWAQNVFFYDLVVEVKSERGRMTRKAQDETRRVIITEPIGSCVAKSWWGLDGCINAGPTPKSAYEAFVAAYLKALKKGGNRQ